MKSTSQPPAATGANGGAVCAFHGTLLDAALAAAARGLAVVPLHGIRPDQKCTCSGRCSKAGKHPRSKKWQKAASMDSEVIRGWWKRWPDANPGVSTGNTSQHFDGHLVVLDFDGPEGLRTWDRLKHEYPSLCSTFRVRTGGGGLHVYAAGPPVGNRVKVKSLPGVDIRGVGGLVVAAGAAHSSGRRYIVEEHGAVLSLPPSLLLIIGKGEQLPRTGNTTQQTGEIAVSGGLLHKRDTSETQEYAMQGCGGGGSYRRSKRQWRDELSAEQQSRLQAAITKTLPQEQGKRNQKLFEFARRCAGIVPNWQEVGVDVFRQWVENWFVAAIDQGERMGFTVTATRQDNWNEFRYGIKRVKTPQTGDGIDGIIRQCAEDLADGLPVVVLDVLHELGYGCDRSEWRTVAAVCLLWRLSMNWPGGVFPLSFAVAADAIGKITGEQLAPQQAQRVIDGLAEDGVISSVERGKPGRRGLASTWRWTWLNYVGLSR